MIDYLSRHWRGELSLPVSYWLNYSLGAFVIGTFAELSADTQWLTTLIIVLSFSIWSVPGTWRSASRYTKSHNKKWWGYIAQTIIVLNLLMLFNSATTGSKDQSAIKPPPSAARSAPGDPKRTAI